MEFILWIIAVILVIYGIVLIFRTAGRLGILVCIAGLLGGPGGGSLFT